MSFEKLLSDVSDRHNPSVVFDDFLQMSVCAFSLGRSEELYHKTCEKYNENEKASFGKALGALILEHEKQTEWCDYLGRFYEAQGQSNAKIGQFFTPETICNLMAKLTESNENETGTVNDPTCGSSRNLIAHSRLYPNNRLKYFYIGQDLDKRCCLMSVLNFVMFGMKGIIIHMNCLSNDIYGGWRIWLPETGLGISPLSVEECKSLLFEQKKEPVIEIKQASNEEPFQLSIF